MRKWLHDVLVFDVECSFSQLQKLCSYLVLILKPSMTESNGVLKLIISKVRTKIKTTLQLWVNKDIIKSDVPHICLHISTTYIKHAILYENTQRCIYFAAMTLAFKPSFTILQQWLKFSINVSTHVLFEKYIIFLFRRQSNILDSLSN